MSENGKSKQSGDKTEKEADKHFWRGLARAFGGAIIFTLPMLMTMEMWWLGFYMSDLRLGLLLAVNFPLLVGLSYFVGFKKTFRWKEDVVDALTAYMVGFTASVAILFLFSVIEFDMSAGEIIGKVSLQAVPGSMGAMLAQSQLGRNNNDKEEKERRAGFWGQMFIMAAGALFLAFNLAPTEEMILIAFKMSEWQVIALALISIAVMHAFVYALAFKGTASVPENTSFWSVLLRYTINGYAIALLISLYVLWTFGRTENVSTYKIINDLIVLGFPAAVGAASARLII